MEDPVARPEAPPLPPSPLAERAMLPLDALPLPWLTVLYCGVGAALVPVLLLFVEWRVQFFYLSLKASDWAFGVFLVATHAAALAFAVAAADRLLKRRPRHVRWSVALGVAALYPIFTVCALPDADVSALLPFTIYELVWAVVQQAGLGILAGLVCRSFGGITWRLPMLIFWYRLVLLIGFGVMGEVCDDVLNMYEGMGHDRSAVVGLTYPFVGLSIGLGLALGLYRARRLRDAAAAAWHHGR